MTAYQQVGIRDALAVGGGDAVDVLHRQVLDGVAVEDVNVAHARAALDVLAPLVGVGIVEEQGIAVDDRHALLL